MRAHALPVLMYHHVSPSPGLVTVSPQTFRAQMAWLARHGYRSVGCEELAAFLRGEALAPRSVLITFDDGYLDNWVYAHPLLQEFGLHAVIFLITQLIGDGVPRPHAGAGGATPHCPDHNGCKARIAADAADDAMLRWSEVAAMRVAGTAEFHSHTHSHTRWDRQIADRQARMAALGADLAASRAALTQRLGHASAHLCWPQGWFDDDYVQVARQHGFNYLYTTRPGTNPPSQPADAIRRIVVKDRPGAWFSSRMWLYRHPRLTGIYSALRGDENR